MSDEHKKRPQSPPQDIQRALYGGVPMGRWKEGLLFEGIAPTPGLKSAANWFPRTEKLGPDEMRIIFMGTSPMLRPGQMNTSVFVQLGNRDNFIFDLGEGPSPIASLVVSLSMSWTRCSSPISMLITLVHFRICTCSADGQGVGTRSCVSLVPPAALPSTGPQGWSKVCR